MRSSRCVFAVVVIVVMSACGSAADSVSSQDPETTESTPESAGEGSAPASDQTVDSTPEPTTEIASPTTSSAPAGSGDLPFGLQRCDAEFSTISADPSFYRDEPVYVGNEQPTEAVRAWAQQQPDFADIWIDRNNNGWLVVGFTSDADQRQADLESEFPGVGVVAAQVEFSMEELDALRDEVFAVMTANGISVQGGASVPRGEVDVFVGVLDAATLGLFSEFAGDPVCFEGVAPEDAIVDGPQPTDGDGWRLLAVERTGNSYRTGVATEDNQYTELWNLSGVTAERPEVDFDTEIVIWFGAVYGSSCEIRMDGVVFDLERSIVHADFVIPGNPGGCTADANPEAYLVAVERSALPTGPFSVQLSDRDPPNGVPEERTVVDVDLSTAGATASADQLGVDDALIDQVDRGYVVGPGGFVEPGFEAVFEFDLSCPIDVIGPINGVVWQSVEPERGPLADEAWEAVAEANAVVFTQILLDIDPARMSLTANGVTESYLPGGSDLESTCDGS